MPHFFKMEGIKSIMEGFEIGIKSKDTTDYWTDPGTESNLTDAKVQDRIIHSSIICDEFFRWTTFLSWDYNEIHALLVWLRVLVISIPLFARSVKIQMIIVFFFSA